MASIYKRNNKLWVSVYQHGRQVRKSTGLIDTPENRKRIVRELLPMLEEADLSIKKTVGYYYSEMMRGKDLKPTSVRKYASIFNKHISQFQDKRIDSFKVSNIKKWVYDLDVSPKQIHSVVSVFKMIFQEAIYDEAISKNPFSHIKLPRLVKYSPEPFSSEEVALLMSNADGWFRNFLAVLFMTGMRIGEALALEWADIDEFIRVDKSLTEGVLGNTKTDNTRHIPIFNDLKPYLQNQKLLTGLANKRVFVGLSDSRDLIEYWHPLLIKCGIGHRVLYQARHTFAINALDSGLFKVSQIANMLGHASVQMLFSKYAKFIKSEISEMPKDFSTLSTVLSTKAV